MSTQSIVWLNKSVNVQKHRSESENSSISINSRMKATSQIYEPDSPKLQIKKEHRAKSHLLNGGWSAPHKKESIKTTNSKLLRIVDENEEEKAANNFEKDSKKMYVVNDGTKTT